MKLFIFLLLLGNLSFAQQLKTQEIDGLVILPEKNPALVEKNPALVEKNPALIEKNITTNSHNNSSTTLSNREIDQLIRDIYTKPYEQPTGKFGLNYNANGNRKITFCSRAPEPNTNLLMLIGLSSLLLFRRKLI